MLIEVKLMKKNVTFTDKDGNRKRSTNLYIQVGNEYIPIEVVFFPNDKCEGRDPAFSGRMAILSAVAEELPPLPSKKNNTPGAQG